MGNLVVGKHCIICKRDMEESNNITKEDILPKLLFLYPKAIVAEVTCRECNVLTIGRQCEREFFNDPLIQQAKMFNYPIDLRDKKKRGWRINSKIAYHRIKAGYQSLFDASGKPANFFAYEPSESIWRSIGKTVLCLIAVNSGNVVFRPSLDKLRDFVRFGGSYQSSGLRRGLRKGSGRWENYHMVRIEVPGQRSFLIEVGLFGNYGFMYQCHESYNGKDERFSVLKIGALQRHWESAVVFKDGTRIPPHASNLPLFWSARYLKGLHGLN